MLDYFEVDAMLFHALFGDLARVSLIQVDQGHALAGELLHRLVQLFNLSQVLFVGWRYVQTQQMSQGYHRSEHPHPFAPLSTIVAGPDS